MKTERTISGEARKEYGEFFTSILHDSSNKLHIFPL